MRARLSALGDVRRQAGEDGRRAAAREREPISPPRRGRPRRKIGSDILLKENELGSAVPCTEDRGSCSNKFEFKADGDVNMIK